jgi:hypothetical protein
VSLLPLRSSVAPLSTATEAVSPIWSGRPAPYITELVLTPSPMITLAGIACAPLVLPSIN